jgi:Group II intron, maturase-specific domain
MSKGAAVAVCEVFPRPPVSNCSASATSCHSNLFTPLRQAKGISIETTAKRLATCMVGWRGYFGFREPPEVLIGLVRWVRLRLRCVLWRSGRLHGVAEPRCCNWGYVRDWPPTRLVVVAAPGTWPAPKPSPWELRMHTSAHSVFLHCSRTNSLTSRTAVYGPVRNRGPARCEHELKW